MPLLDEVASLLSSTPGFPAEARTDPTASRAYLDALRSIPAPPIRVRVATVEDEVIEPGLTARIYAPDFEAGLPIAVFFHGGGWTMGDLDMHDPTCRAIAAAGAVVVSIDYRLAPEHPFPAAFDDAVAAVRWAAANATRLGADPARLVVVGTSSGANLAAAAVLAAAADPAGPAVAEQVLVYPVLTASMSSPSWREFASGYFLEREQMAWFWDQYVPDPQQRADPRCSPGTAPMPPGLAPAFVVTAEFDPLRDDGEEFVARLQHIGIGAELVRVDGTIHGFLTHADEWPHAQQALHLIAQRIAATEPNRRES